MAKHLPTVVWGLRKKTPSGYVRTTSSSMLLIALPDERTGKDGKLLGLEMTRSTARLLARRIEQCLEETK